MGLFSGDGLLANECHGLKIPRYLHTLVNPCQTNIATLSLQLSFIRVSLLLGVGLRVLQ